MYNCMKPMAVSLASIVVIGSLVLPIESSSNEFTVLTSCTCPDHQLIFECTAFGPAATLWNGTALEQCPGGQIFMRHSDYQSGRSWMCNGPIIGNTIGVNNGSYTSQVAVTISDGLNSREIQCSHDNGDNIAPIGVRMIQITTAPMPPPTNISLFSVQRGQLTIGWDPVVQNCPALYYYVIASNCGACQTTTVHNFITCTNVTELMESSFHVCTVIVETVVCDDIFGTNSEPLVILIKVPDAPNTLIIPEYSGETRLLQRMLLNLTEPEHFLLANAIDGSATSYTIIISEAISGSQCDSVIISASTCWNGVCTYEFNVSSSSCPPFMDITVTTFATNVLGDGPLSNTIAISAVNNFIRVRFESAISTILCIFSDEAKNSVKYCEIIYGLTECHNASSVSYANGKPSASQTVQIALSLNEPAASDHRKSYCYKIMGTNGTNTITISGTFVTGCDPALLGNVTQATQSTSLCGSSHTPLSTSKGFVCYSGTSTGSNAIYYCFDCGYNTINKSAGSFIRTCQSNGKWDGAIPDCVCSHIPLTSSHSQVGIISGFIASLLFLITLIITFISTLVFFLKLKAKLMLELKKEKDKNIIYDVIGSTQTPQAGPGVDTDANIAYMYIS